MKPVDMIVKHDPHNGTYGDCCRACIASIFELKAEEVPHFCDGDYPDNDHPWFSLLQAWLNARGFHAVYFEIDTPEHEWPAAALQFHYLRDGKTRRGTLHHCVYYGRRLVHDPQWEDRVGLLEDVYPQNYLLIVKK